MLAKGFEIHVRGGAPRSTRRAGTPDRGRGARRDGAERSAADQSALFGVLARLQVSDSNSSKCDDWATCERPAVTGLCPDRRPGTDWAGRTVRPGRPRRQVRPRHSVIVGADGLPELLAALEVCNRRGIEIELISSRARFAAHTAHSRTLPEDDTAG